MTLVVSLVMLVVLTLLVVSAIRFGNINLKIAGNVQAETEAAAAAQVATETTMATMAAAPDISTLTASTMTVSTGGASYQVAVTKPACIMTKQVLSTSLDPDKVSDQACIEGSGTSDPPIKDDGTQVAKPTACKDQQWDVTATVNDSAGSGAAVTVLQGAAVRVGAEVQCP
jgi:Tfp pilus assembly protein PilX